MRCFVCSMVGLTYAEPEVLVVENNDWEEPLYSPFRYLVLYGGRSSGKTQAAAKKLVIEVAHGKACHILRAGTPEITAVIGKAGD